VPPLESHLRTDDVVARFGGDEFVLVLENLSGVNDAALVAQKALTCCTEPFEIEGQELHVGASIGVALYPEDGTDGETLLKHADIAMYRAKDIGRGTYRFYDAHMNARGTERLMLESALRPCARAQRARTALPAEDGPVQPPHRRRGGTDAWRHPLLGMVPPAQFIPIAEETGLIQAMGRWALERACADAVSWQEQGLPAVQMAVNLSPRQLDSLTSSTMSATSWRSRGCAPRCWSWRSPRAR
jgi:predicted signal transduction protein with EAL and GGDEF domain